MLSNGVGEPTPTEHIHFSLITFLFVDDIVLINEIRVGINYKLKMLGETLESKSLKLGRTKTEYMQCRISNKY